MNLLSNVYAVQVATNIAGEPLFLPRTGVKANPSHLQPKLYTHRSLMEMMETGKQYSHERKRFKLPKGVTWLEGSPLIHAFSLKLERVHDHDSIVNALARMQ